MRDLVERWPVDIITSEELHERLGENRAKGTVLRYALERAGIVKVGKWSAVTHFGRKEVACKRVTPLLAMLFVSPAALFTIDISFGHLLKGLAC